MFTSAERYRVRQDPPNLTQEPSGDTKPTEKFVLMQTNLLKTALGGNLAWGRRPLLSFQPPGQLSPFVPRQLGAGAGSPSVLIFPLPLLVRVAL